MKREGVKENNKWGVNEEEHRKNERRYGQREIINSCMSHFDFPTVTELVDNV